MQLNPMKKSCQDLERILARSFQDLARNQAIQDFHMDLEQESCKIRSLKSWHGFGTANLPNLETFWQDLARYF